MPYVPLFFPFIYEFSGPIDDPVQFWLISYVTKPEVYMTEIIGIVILLFIALNNNLYSIPDVLTYLKTSQQISIEKKDNNILVKKDNNILINKEKRDG